MARRYLDNRIQNQDPAFLAKNPEVIIYQQYRAEHY
jgi:hypothetical protein